jgi:hypothetical protein
MRPRLPNVIKGGKLRDVLGLGLLAEDWAAARAAVLETLKRMGVQI